MWTGSEMIVWGGDAGTTEFQNTGGRYDPAADSWTTIRPGPAPRRKREPHGGLDRRRDDRLGRLRFQELDHARRRSTTPATDDPSWTVPHRRESAFRSRRAFHTAVWTGSEMIVWGGFYYGDGYHHSGGIRSGDVDTLDADQPDLGAPDGRRKIPHRGVDRQRDDRLGRLLGEHRGRSRLLQDGGSLRSDRGFLDADTGEVRVADASGLDYEIVRAYIFTVEVNDGEFSDTADVRVDVTNVNESPTASEATLEVNEDAAPGTILGTVDADDPDAETSFEFSITGGNEGGAFSVHFHEGEISVADGAQLDHETRDSYLLDVEVSDGELSTMVPITILVNDINEAPVVGDVAKIGDEDEVMAFDTVDFSDAFADEDEGDSVVTIRILELPLNGSLMLGGQPVQADDEVAADAIGGLRFDPDDHWNGETSFPWEGNDGALWSPAPATVALSIEAVNDPPEVRGPGALEASKEKPLSLPDIEVEDRDAGAGSLDVVISVSHGSLSVAEPGVEASDISGNGSSTLTIHGPLGEINAILQEGAGPSYVGNLNFVGADLVVISVSDNGNTGSGGPLDNDAEIVITVVGDEYDDWRAENFDPEILADPEMEDLVWGDTANPDGDSLPNLVESFMGLDPNADDDDIDAVELETHETEDLLLFYYRKAKVSPGVAGEVEYSDDFGLWLTDGIVETVVRDLGDAVLVEARIPLPPEGVTRLIRLRAFRVE